MRRTVGLFLASMALAVLAPAVGAEDKPDEYLTKDGTLKEKLEVRELQGGFAGFTGTYWVIAQDGAWSTGMYGPRNAPGKAAAEGKLTKEQLAGLAKELAKNDLAKLANHGDPVTNPMVTEIHWGKKAAALNPNRPAAVGEKEDAAIRARYKAIADAVKKLSAAPKKG